MILLVQHTVLEKFSMCICTYNNFKCEVFIGVINRDGSKYFNLSFKNTLVSLDNLTSDVHELQLVLRR
jgi:hypothetical protein